MFRHSDVITMGAYTAFSSCLAQDGADSCYSATGLIFQLYRHHFGTIPIAVSGNSPQRELKGTVGVDKPKVASGSDTYPLDVAAALSSDRNSVTVAVVNPTESSQRINLAFNASPAGRGRGWPSPICNAERAGSRAREDVETRSTAPTNWSWSAQCQLCDLAEITVVAWKMPLYGRSASSRLSARDGYKRPPATGSIDARPSALTFRGSFRRSCTDHPADPEGKDEAAFRFRANARYPGWRNRAVLGDSSYLSVVSCSRRTLLALALP
jgi:hypothetical protein